MPTEQPTSIRLPVALKRKLAAAARTEKRRLSVQIVYILQQWCDWFERKKS